MRTLLDRNALVIYILIAVYFANQFPYVQLGLAGIFGIALFAGIYVNTLCISYRKEMPDAIKRSDTINTFFIVIPYNLFMMYVFYTFGITFITYFIALFIFMRLICISLYYRY